MRGLVFMSKTIEELAYKSKVNYIKVFVSKQRLHGLQMSAFCFFLNFACIDFQPNNSVGLHSYSPTFCRQNTENRFMKE